MKRIALATIIAVAMLFASCCNYVWIPVPMPDNEPEHVHTYETVIDATGDDMYQVVRCSECGEELSRLPYTGNTVTGADGTEYKTIEEAITAFNNQSAGSYTLTIADGEYAVESMSLDQTVEGRSITITAETVGGVTLSAKETVTTDKGIFTVDSDSKYRENSPVVIKGINFDLSNVSDGILSAVTLGTGTDRYAQNITLEDCHFVGLQDNSYAVDVNAKR